MTMTNRWVGTVAALVAVGVALNTAGCSSKSTSKSSSSSEPSASSASASRIPPSSAFLDVLGEDGLSALGMLDGPSRESALFGASAVPHTDVEPARFSATWVGVEAGEVLKKAVAKEYEQATVSTATRDCLIFHQGGIVRRLMTNDANESHEYAMSAKGNILLWLRAARDAHQSRQLAFFHQGKNLELYQEWEGNGARRTRPAPNGLKEYIFSEAKDCFDKFHAKNPAPGVGASVGDPPPPPPPPPAPPAKVENSYSFKVDAVSFYPADTIHVTFNAPLAPPANNQFWIAIVPADAPDSTFAEWHYLKAGSQTEDISAPAPGDYEIRLHDAFPMFPYRVMARQRITVNRLPTPDPPADAECENVRTPGTLCKLPSGLRGYCELTAHVCVDQCPDGLGIGPDGQCYPACPSNGACGEGCSCDWGVCVCPPGD